MTTTAVGLVQASQVVGGCGRARDWPDWEREFGQRPHRCNIVYARFSALNDVQRRPSKSRHALALIHCPLYLQRI